MFTHLRIVRRQRLVGGVKQQLVPDVLRVAAGGAPPLDGQVAVQLCMDQIESTCFELVEQERKLSRASKFTDFRRALRIYTFQPPHPCQPS